MVPFYLVITEIILIFTIISFSTSLIFLLIITTKWKLKNKITWNKTLLVWLVPLAVTIITVLITLILAIIWLYDPYAFGLDSTNEWTIKNQIVFSLVSFFINILNIALIFFISKKHLIK